MKKINYRFQSKKVLLEEYQNCAKSYDKSRSRSFSGKRSDFVERRLIKNEIFGNKAKKILEVGCGTGRILLYLASKGYECYGEDYSENMLRQLQTKAKRFNLKVDTKLGDIEKINYPDNNFDCTYTMHVLMHLPTGFKKAFKEMYRVTKKDGIIIFDLPNKNSIWTRASLIIDSSKERTRFYTLKEVSEYLSGYNYKVHGLYPFSRFFYEYPIIRKIIVFLEEYLPIPARFGSLLIFTVKK